MNRRGIILSTLIYTLVVFFLLIVVSILLVLNNRQGAIDNIKKEANEIYSES